MPALGLDPALSKVKPYCTGPHRPNPHTRLLLHTLPVSHQPLPFCRQESERQMRDGCKGAAGRAQGRREERRDQLPCHAQCIHVLKLLITVSPSLQQCACKNLSGHVQDPKLSTSAQKRFPHSVYTSYCILI